MQLKAPQLNFILGGDLIVHRIGYGAMRLTGQPGNFGPYADWQGGKELLRRAVRLGVNFVDTAGAYGPGANEDIIREALHPYYKTDDEKSSRVIITTKGGIDKQAPDRIFRNASPEFLKQGVQESRKRLGVDCIDLYQLHFPDPKVPFLSSIQALKEMKDDGHIRHIGLSNVSLEQLKEAEEIVQIASVQMKYSLLDRSNEDILEYTKMKGIAFIPYGSLGAHPMKRGSPMAVTSDTAGDESQPLQTLSKIAKAHESASSTQIALAWLLHHAPNTLLIPGTTTMAHLEDNMKAADIRLTSAEYEELSALAQPASQRVK